MNCKDIQQDKKLTTFSLISKVNSQVNDIIEKKSQTSSIVQKLKKEMIKLKD